MPAPDRMLTHLRQAIALSRATPGRRGHVVELLNAADVLVAGSAVFRHQEGPAAAVRQLQQLAADAPKDWA